MSERIKITREMLLAASDYMPNAEKERWVTDNAAKCFDKLAITADGETMPPMYKVNEGLKRRYLMAAFAKEYMRQGYGGDERDPALMAEEEYDRWAGSHVFEQVNRMKHDTELRDKCFDLLADYKDLEKRFSSELNSLLTVQNDFVLRQSEYTAAQMKDLPEVIAQLKSLQEARGNDD